MAPGDLAVGVREVEAGRSFIEGAGVGAIPQLLEGSIRDFDLGVST